MSKTALVLSGGGAKGSYQLGAILYLIREYYKCNPFDIVTGTSIGAINGAMVAQDSIDELEELWLSMKKKSDILKPRLFRHLGLVFGADSWSSSDPLWKMIDKHVDIDKLRKGAKYICSVHETQTLRLHHIHGDDTNISKKDMKKFILASASIPGEFPPVRIGNGKYVDGGVREVTPIQPAIDQGAEVIYVLQCSPMKLQPLDKEPSGFGILTSTLSALVNEVYNEDMTKARFINSIINQYRTIREYLIDIGKDEDHAIKEALETLEETLGKYRMLRLIDLQPKEIPIDTLCLDPSKIRTAIARGQIDMQKRLQEFDLVD